MRRRLSPLKHKITVIFLESGLPHVESALITRCHDQHETTSTPSVAPLDVTSKTQRKAQWISQDGTPKLDPLQEAEEVEVDHLVEGEVDEADHQVTGDEEAKALLLNVLANPGESRSRASFRLDHEGFMYTVYDPSLSRCIGCTHTHRIVSLEWPFTRNLSGSDNKVRPAKRAWMILS